jgi:Spy/CpxP family protein refolding chaperone
MRNFAKSLLVAALVVPLATHAAVAQNPATPAQPGQEGMGRGMGGGQRRLQALLQGITLTADQQKKVDSISAAARDKMPAMTPGSPPDSGTRAMMRGIMQQSNADIRAVLTADQQAIWDKNLAAMRSRMGRP